MGAHDIADRPAHILKQMGEADGKTGLFDGPVTPLAIYAKPHFTIYSSTPHNPGAVFNRNTDE